MGLVSRLRTWYFGYGFMAVGLGLIGLTLFNTYSLLSKQAAVSVADTRPEVETRLVASYSGTICDETCVKELVAEALVSANAEKTVVEESDVVPTTVKTSLGAERTEIVRLSDGNGSGTEWVSVGGGKWLDTSLYGQLQSATWEGWLEVPGGSGEAYVRLYDATNARAVDGSEVKAVNTLRTSFYSKNLSIWRGQNQYFVQVRSSGGGEVRVSSAQMKLKVR